MKKIVDLCLKISICACSILFCSFVTFTQIGFIAGVAASKANDNMAWNKHEQTISNAVVYSNTLVSVRTSSPVIGESTETTTTQYSKPAIAAKTVKHSFTARCKKAQLPKIVIQTQTEQNTPTVTEVTADTQQPPPLLTSNAFMPVNWPVSL
ncbi:MAG: hypothetical protein QM731_05285 [Chitinophagaceae bacterium]